MTTLTKYVRQDSGFSVSAPTVVNNFAELKSAVESALDGNGFTLAAGVLSSDLALSMRRDVDQGNEAIYVRFNDPNIDVSHNALFNGSVMSKDLSTITYPATVVASWDSINVTGYTSDVPIMLPVAISRLPTHTWTLNAGDTSDAPTAPAAALDLGNGNTGPSSVAGVFGPNDAARFGGTDVLKTSAAPPEEFMGETFVQAGWLKINDLTSPVTIFGVWEDVDFNRTARATVGVDGAITFEVSDDGSESGENGGQGTIQYVSDAGAIEEGVEYYLEFVKLEKSLEIYKGTLAEDVALVPAVTNESFIDLPGPVHAWPMNTTSPIAASVGGVPITGNFYSTGQSHWPFFEQGHNAMRVRFLGSSGESGSILTVGQRGSIVAHLKTAQNNAARLSIQPLWTTNNEGQVVEPTTGQTLVLTLDGYGGVHRRRFKIYNTSGGVLAELSGTRARTYYEEWDCIIATWDTSIVGGPNVFLYAADPENPLPVLLDSATVSGDMNAPLHPLRFEATGKVTLQLPGGRPPGIYPGGFGEFGFAGVWDRVLQPYEREFLAFNQAYTTTSPFTAKAPRVPQVPFTLGNSLDETQPLNGDISAWFAKDGLWGERDIVRRNATLGVETSDLSAISEGSVLNLGIVDASTTHNIYAGIASRARSQANLKLATGQTLSASNLTVTVELPKDSVGRPFMPRPYDITQPDFSPKVRIMSATTGDVEVLDIVFHSDVDRSAGTANMTVASCVGTYGPGSLMGVSPHPLVLVDGVVGETIENGTVEAITLTKINERLDGSGSPAIPPVDEPPHLVSLGYSTTEGQLSGTTLGLLAASTARDFSTEVTVRTRNTQAGRTDPALGGSGDKYKNYKAVEIAGTNIVTPATNYSEDD